MTVTTSNCAYVDPADGVTFIHSTGQEAVAIPTLVACLRDNGYDPREFDLHVDGKLSLRHTR